MIKIIMLDLGETLVSGDVVLPHVRPALDALKQFQTAQPESVEICLISDYYLADPVDDPQQISQIFSDYQALLRKLDLFQYFEPVERHVTLSTHAGVYKPAKKVFDHALQRLGVESDLTQCLFVTENAEHVNACRLLGISALQFGDGGDFKTWAEGPLYIAQAIDNNKNTGNDNNLKLALQHFCETELDYESVNSIQPEGPNQYLISGKAWQSMRDISLGEFDGVQVPVATTASVSLPSNTADIKVEVHDPSSDIVREVTQYVISLVKTHAISSSDSENKQTQSASHIVEKTSSGLRRLIRRRFF